MIVDASVAVKWLVREPRREKALRLLGHGDLKAPDCIDIEIGQALTRLARQSLIARDDAERLWSEASEAPLGRAPWRDYADKAFGLSLNLRATFNDCLYLAMAVTLGEVLVTADEQFLRAVQTDPALRGQARSLADFPG